MPQFCVDSLLIFSRPATQILIPARGAIILCHARDFCCCSPKLIIFRFRKNIIFPKIFSWLEQRAGGVTVGGFQKIPEKRFFFSIFTNNLLAAIHETHCGTTQLPLHGTLFIIISLYFAFADFRFSIRFFIKFV